MGYRAKEIECVDCGVMFIWKADEQQCYVSERQSEPKCCSECRQKCRDFIRQVIE